MTTTESTNIPDLTPAQLDSILEWYSGKARQHLLAQALPALRASIQAGAWIPKASRMVPAALSGAHRPTSAARVLDCSMMCTAIA